MTRINTNISSIVAQKTLARSNAELQVALTRLSTGLRINVGKDDPAGLIASEVLRSDIISVQRAITNSERANQLIATADSALGQVSALLNDIRGLVSEAANTGALSDAQITANQLQVDSSLESIDRIARTTAFQGKRLLDGSLDFITTSIPTIGTNASVTVGTDTSTRAAGSGGSVDNAFAAATFSLGTTDSDIAITANTAGTARNDVTIIFQSGAASGSETVTFTGTALTFTIASGTTTANTIISTLNANGGAAQAAFTATTAGGGAGTGVYSAYSTAVTAGGVDGDKFLLSARTTGSAFSGVSLVFASGGTAGAETVSYDSGTKVLTVTIDDGVSTVNQVLSAINAASGANGVFSGALASGSNGLAVVSASTTAAAVTTGGTNANNLFILSAQNAGSTYSGVSVRFTSGATAGSEQVSYNSSTKTLIVQIAEGASTASQVISAINAQSSVFSAGLATGSDGTGTVNLADTGLTSGGSSGPSLQGLQIDQANFGTQSSITVTVDIDTQATRGELRYSGGALTAELNLEIGGQDGFEVFNFGNGSTISQIADAINLVSDATGISATVSGSDLVFTTNDYGSRAFVSVKALTGTFSTNDGVGNGSTREVGTDVSARINGVQAKGDGLLASINTSTLDLSFTVSQDLGAGSSVNFNITGGGANFQLGPDVVSNQQARLGIQGVSTATLGGINGTLFELRSGGSKSLATDVIGAANVVEEVITRVTSLRGRLGAFQKTTLETNIFTLNDTLENLTDAESSIRDADFAAESARLTRAQILVQSGTTVLSIANSNPQNVLALLR
ncbi:MAG: flagellin [Pirellulales bacterium]|nr:flagellin [Pirellulales bacterium]